MRRPSFRFIAAISAALALSALALPVRSARRPKYGGTLRVEISSRVMSSDPATTPAAPEEAIAENAIDGLLYDRRSAGGIFPGANFDSAARGAAKELLPGAFRLTEWEPGKHATLAANPDFREGRPFVDAVDIQMGRSPRDSLLDLEAGKTDFAEIAPEDERMARERGVRTSVSQPDELIALVFLKGKPAAENEKAREAVSLAVDRAAMANFILQKNGEPAGGLLPQWSSGTAFLFPVSVDVAAAKERWHEKANAGPITLGYDAGDTLEQAVAERIVVNSREAGIDVRIVRGISNAAVLANCDALLMSLRMPSGHPAEVLMQFQDVLAPMAGLDATPLPADAAPQLIYERESAIVGSDRVIPLLWLPRVYGLSARVHDWTAPGPGEPWPFANVWLGESP